MNQPVSPNNKLRRKSVQQSKSAATRARILDAAVRVLIEKGLARTTTLEVQKQSGVSRGALLHHFPSHTDLMSSTVAELVQQNEQGVWREAEALSHIADPLTRSVRVLANAHAQPSFVAELELWLAARTDASLRQALRTSERTAAVERDRVLSLLFEGLSDAPRAKDVISLTIEFVRGLAVSGLLREDPGLRDTLITSWTETIRPLVSKDGP